MQKEYYTCEEVAERYSVQESTVWAWIRNGKIAAVKMGRMYRIPKESLDAFEKTMIDAK